MPLDPACREILRGEREAGEPKPPTRSERGRSAASDLRFSKGFAALVAAATAVAAREDARWQKRRRVFDSLPVMLFALRLVAAPRGQGCRTTLCEIREQCAAAGVDLPQDEPPAASTACAAREKLDEGAFRRLHAEILATGPECPFWKGRRILAVDGSKPTLPRELAARGFRVPDGAHHPQGMAAPCRLRGRIPVDFDLFGHENERLAALTHLERAAEGDVIVHDRGCWSFAMALARRERGLDFVFRLKKGTNPTFDAFDASGETERTVTRDAPRDETALRGRSLRARLVRYVAGDTEYGLATSLTDGGRFGVRALSELCHGRRGIEEMHKSGKSVTERFHARSERGVRQEPCAAFVLLTLTRRFSSRCDGDPDAGGGEDGLTAMRSNFRNGLRLVGKEIEALSLKQAGAVRNSVARIMTGLSRRLQRERPGRSCPRRSMRPRSKWQNRQAA